MDIQRKMYLERAGLINEDWDQLISESYVFDEDNIHELIAVYEELQQVVEALPKSAYVSAMRKATDPDSDGGMDSDRIVARARKHHGNKFASDLESGAHKMHFPRQGHVYGSDKLSNRTPSRVTKSGKANKQDISALKSKLKPRY